MTRGGTWLARSFKPYTLSANVLLRPYCPIFNFRDREKSIQTDKYILQFQAVSTKKVIGILKYF